MKIKKIKNSNTHVVLFLEQTSDDYLFNHQLSLVNDDYETKQTQLYNTYQMLPKSALVSDRACAYKSILIKKS